MRAAQPHLEPHDQFISFFGCDGVGKTAITTEVAHTLGNQAIRLRGTWPDTWPGGPPDQDYFALSQRIDSEPDEGRQAIARQEFTHSIVAANYSRVAQLIAGGTVVLNDSDVLLKSLTWTHLQGRSISKCFEDLSMTITEDAAGIFPAYIMYICVPGGPEAQVETLAERLNSRGRSSASDPTTIEEIRKRVAANERVYDFLVDKAPTIQHTVQRIENPVFAPEEVVVGLQAIARTVIRASSIAAP